MDKKGHGATGTLINIILLVKKNEQTTATCNIHDTKEEEDKALIN